MARLLILTLSSGEAALAVQSRQLANQSFQDFEHEIISGLPNQAAHNRLYRTIMDKASSFDLFMKLDGDMTFRTDNSLADAIRVTDEYPDGQHFAFPVWDCFTERSEEHTSELQSPCNLVCRLLLEKKKYKHHNR